jgi:molybdopterin synthase catalytic subunit
MKDKSAGAVSKLLGTTRDNFDNKKVTKLFYEAHPTMTIKKLRKIAEYANEKFNLLKIAAEVVQF